MNERELKNVLYNFMSKYYRKRNPHIRITSYLPYPYFNGVYVGKLKPAEMPPDISRAYAELSLALMYVDYTTNMTQMKKDFYKVYKMFLNATWGCGQCTYKHVGGLNKVYESTNEEAIMIHAVDTAYDWLADYQ